MKISIFTSILWMSITLLFLSCQKEPISPPNIIYLSVNGFNEYDWIIHNAGEPLMIAGVFESGEDISRCNIKLSHQIDPEGMYNLSLDEDILFDDQQKELNQALIIPSNTKSGPYDLQISVFNAEGGKSSISFHLAINNSTGPALDLQFPIEDQTFQSGDEITLAGSIMDDKDLKNINITLESIRDSTGNLSSGGMLYQYDFSLNSENDTIWNMESMVTVGEKIVINPDFEDFGAYGLYILAKDNDQNIMLQRITIFIK